MPLPKASDKQTTERLEALYDEYCKIAFEALMEYEVKPKSFLATTEESAGFVARQCHTYATAMLNERNKK